MSVGTAVWLAAFLGATSGFALGFAVCALVLKVGF